MEHCGQWGNETMDAGHWDDLALEQWDNGTIDTGTIGQWTNGTRGPWGKQTVGQCDTGTMGQFDNRPWDDRKLGQWTRGQSDNGTMDSSVRGQLDIGTMYGHWDNGTTRKLDSGTLGHWDDGTLVKQSVLLASSALDAPRTEHQWSSGRIHGSQRCGQISSSG
jgi:hypothetical protein